MPTDSGIRHVPARLCAYLSTDIGMLVLGTLAGLGTWRAGVQRRRADTLAVQPSGEIVAATIPVQQRAVTPSRQRSATATVMLTSSPEQVALIEQARDAGDAAGLLAPAQVYVLVAGTDEEMARAQQLIWESALFDVVDFLSRESAQSSHSRARAGGQSAS
jgi:hypothetical protein